MIIVIVQRSCRDEKNHKRNKNPIEILVSMTKAYFLYNYYFNFDKYL